MIATRKPPQKTDKKPSRSRDTGAENPGVAGSIPALATSITLTELRKVRSFFRLLSLPRGTSQRTPLVMLPRQIELGPDYGFDSCRRTADMALVVYKLGGSLLSLDDLAVRLRAVLRERPDDRSLIVVGGGSAADVVREWSGTHGLTEPAAHWLAVRSLSLNRGLVQHLLSESREVSSREEILPTGDSRVPLLLDVEACLRRAELANRCSLPKCWDVTTDSIAAWVAREWAAEELVLLKSIEFPEKLTLNEAAVRGLVDPHFSLVAPDVPRVSWCNLREAHPRIVTWRG